MLLHQVTRSCNKMEEDEHRPVMCVVNLTVASTHPAVVVGHSNEVIATGPRVGVDEELRHVQVSAGNTSYKHTLYSGL